jgi:hypothetical protein
MVVIIHNKARGKALEYINELKMSSSRCYLPPSQSPPFTAIALGLFAKPTQIYHHVSLSPRADRSSHRRSSEIHRMRTFPDFQDVILEAVHSSAKGRRKMFLT